MNKLVKQVYNDYFELMKRLQDNYYSSIYYLVELLESEWNCRGANLRYYIDIKNNYLYLENTKICPMNQLVYCYANGDAVKYKLRDNRELVIVIQWVSGNDAFINQMYISDDKDEDNDVMLYDKDNILKVNKL